MLAPACAGAGRLDPAMNHRSSLASSAATGLSCRLPPSPARTGNRPGPTTCDGRNCRCCWAMSRPGWWGDAGAQTELTVWSDGRAQRNGAPGQAGDGDAGMRTAHRPDDRLPSAGDAAAADRAAVSQGRPRDIGAAAHRRHRDGWRRGRAAFIDAALAVIDPVAKAEQVAINQFSNWKHPFSRKERAKIPVEWRRSIALPWSRCGVDGVSLRSGQALSPRQ